MESVIRWLAPRPLLLFSPAFLLGLWMGGPLLPALGIFTALAPFTRSSRWGKLLLIPLLGFTAGQVRIRMIPTLPDIPAGENIQISGTVLGPSRHFHSRGQGMARFDIKIDGGKLQVRIYQEIAPLLGGERVTLRGKILPLRPPMNPGQFDWAQWLRRRGFRATIQATQVEVHSDPNLLSKIRHRIKKRWKRVSPPEVSGLTTALLLGERDGLDQTFVENLRRSGGAHFLALSGLHISVIGAAFWMGLSILGIRRRWKIGTLIALLWGYATLTGFPISVVRATTMATFWLGADLLGRKRDALVSLAASALVILLFNPEERQNIGFQLSFLAVLGILLFLPLFPKSRIAGLFAVSLSAWATTSPLVQYHFNLLSPLFTLTNILAFPFVILVMAGGAASLLIEEASFVTKVAYEGLSLISHHLSHIPGGHFFRAAPAPESLTLYFLALGIFLVWMKRRPRFSKVFLLLPLLLALGWSTPAEPRTRITVLSMGRGLCVYGEFRDGRNFLFDAGSLDYRDPGRAIVAPFLWSRGISRIDTLFLSHPDADHINGTNSLLDRFPVGRVVLSTAFEGSPFVKSLQGRVPLYFVERTSRAVEISPGIELLGPPDWDRFGRKVPTNETSLVLRISDGDRRILLTGDIQEKGTARLLKEMKDIRAEILVAPHHGKSNKRMEELVHAVDPIVTIVPGPRRYASEKTLDILEEESLLLVTGTSGAIDLEANGERWKVRPYRGILFKK